MRTRLFFFLLAFGASLQVPIRAATDLPLGAVRYVGSNHSTTPDGIQYWESTSMVSPSGQWYYEDTYDGLDRPDGYSSVPITLNEPGLWQVWLGFGFAAPQSASTWQQPDEVLNVGASPPNLTPIITWTVAPATAASGQTYAVTAHGHDDDGNLTEVRVWKNGQAFAFGGGGNGSDADSGNSTSDGGPQNITFTAQSVDADGATSPVITHVITIDAPVSPPVQYALSTSASLGGSVSPGGWFSTGLTATMTALPDATHDFAGWSGDAGGSSNPLGVLMDRDKTVQAVFAVKSFPLTTSAITGGSVTPGGSYPYGTTVALSAVADATHRFVGWTGDATGSLTSIALTMDAPKAVEAVFADKLSQNILFSPPGNQPVGTPAVSLAASASSGLPVTFAVVSGPATIVGGDVQVTGSGTIIIQATQTGDDLYLPAAPVSQAFNVFAAAILKYRASNRTLLQAGTANGSPNYVLEKP